MLTWVWVSLGKQQPLEAERWEARSVERGSPWKAPHTFKLLRWKRPTLVGLETFCGKLRGMCFTKKDTGILACSISSCSSHQQPIRSKLQVFIIFKMALSKDSLPLPKYCSCDSHVNLWFTFTRKKILIVFFFFFNFPFTSCTVIDTLTVVRSLWCHFHT